MLTPEQEAALRLVGTPWPEQKPTIKPSKSKWFSRNHELVFQMMLRQKPDGVFMEFGTWTGAGSTRYVVDNFPRMTVVCVDTFEGSEEHQRIEEYKKIVVDLWDHFCANQWENRDRVFPLRMRSVQAVYNLSSTGFKPDFVYIDAAHDAGSVFEDIKAAIEHFPEATIFGDDYTTPKSGKHPGVRHGIEKAIEEKLFAVKQFNYRGRVWYLTRKVK